MVVYEISYDLNDPGQDYDELHEAIEALGDSLHALESYWLVDASNTSTSDIRDDLKGHLNTNDQLVVTKMKQTGSGRWATSSASEVHEWLDDHL